MLISDDPTKLEERAAALDRRADEAEQSGRPLTALHLRSQATSVRARADTLRQSRRDGVRFG
jgi:hypothetical protein